MKVVLKVVDMMVYVVSAPEGIEVEVHDEEADGWIESPYVAEHLGDDGLVISEHVSEQAPEDPVPAAAVASVIKFKAGDKVLVRAVRPFDDLPGGILPDVPCTVRRVVTDGGWGDGTLGAIYLEGYCYALHPADLELVQEALMDAGDTEGGSHD